MSLGSTRALFELFAISGIGLACCSPVGSSNSSEAVDVALDDLSELAQLLDIHDAKYIGLGESHHFAGAMLDAKMAMTKAAILYSNVRVVAFESPWFAAFRINDQLGDCHDSSRIVSLALSSPWRNFEVVELFDWICLFNRNNPSDEVAVIGFDVQQPSQDAQQFANWISQTWPDLSSLILANLSNCDAFGAMQQVAELGTLQKQCLEAIGEAELLFEQMEQPLNRHASFARLHLRGIRSWQHYWFSLVSDDLSSLYATDRDAAMFDVLTTIVDNELSERTAILWAHNGHLARSTHLDKWPGAVNGLGTLLARSFGERYVAFGIISTVIERPDGVEIDYLKSISSLEHKLWYSRSDVLWLDFRNTSDGSLWRDATTRYDVGGVSIRPAEQFDALLWVRQSTSASFLPE